MASLVLTFFKNVNIPSTILIITAPYQVIITLNIVYIISTVSMWV